MAARPERQRSKPLQVRVTADELELFKQAARKAGLSVSGWVRDRLKARVMLELRAGEASPQMNASGVRARPTSVAKRRG